MARFSALGAPCQDWSVLSPLLSGLALDNAAATVSNTLADLVAKPAPAGTQHFNGARYISSTANGAGTVPPMAGKMLMVTGQYASSALQFMDISTGALTAGPTVTEANSLTGGMFIDALRLADGRFLLVPSRAANFWYYDPYAHTVAQGPAHGLTTSSTAYAYGGGTVGADDKAYLSVGQAGGQTPRVHILDATANTLDTTNGYQFSYPANWATVDSSGEVILLPDGTLLFLTKNGAGSQPMTRVSANGRTLVASIANANIIYGGCLSPDGKKVVVAAASSNVKYVRLSDNTYVTGPAHGLSVGATNPFCKVRLHTDGATMLLFPRAATEICKFDPVNDTVSTVANLTTLALGAAAASTNAINVTALLNGAYVIHPGTSGLTDFVKFTPLTGTASGFSEGIAFSRYGER